MRGRAVLGVFVICACAEVPASVCFSDEPCAADASGGGTGSLGGGTAGGGMTNTGGGGTGGGAPEDGGLFTDAGTPDAGWSRPVRFGSFAFETTWQGVSSTLHQAATQPVFTRIAVPLDAGTSGCAEYFRGGVAMPNGHVLGIPFCTQRFLDFNPADQSYRWIGDGLLHVPAPPRGHFGGGVLGCDGRVYALPFARSAIMRFDPFDGGFDELRLNAVHHFSGGVIVSACDSFLIVAAGDDGLWGLDVYEQGALVSHLSQNVPSAQGRRFEGVARLGDDLVLSAPALPMAGGQELTLLFNRKTGVASTQVVPFVPGAVHGVASTLSEDVFFASETGSSGVFSVDAGWQAGPTTTRTYAWSASSLDGWVYASAGGTLVGFEEGGQVVVSLSNASAPQQSGGLVVLPNGDVVDFPGFASGPASILFYAHGASVVGGGNEALGPWFNKL